MKKKPQGAAAPMIAVDRKSEKPLHRQIYDAFRAMILERSLQPGQQIPSTRALADELGISRIPTLDAYAQLLAEGYIESRSGAGTFVKSSLSDQFLSVRPQVADVVEGAGSDAISRFARLLPVERTPWFPSSGAFSVGQIAYDHFPFRVWSDLVTHHARRVHASAMNYADPMGSEQFREVIAAYLRTARAVRCEASQIMVVNGSQHALDLSARVLLDSDTPVWMEEPGYELLRHTLTLSGCRLIPVPVDSEGLDVGAGVKLCRKARAAFVSPSHQYPLGATMSAARRLQLLEWAHHSNAWIVEDDYDSEYRYESMPVASMQGLDPGARVIYIGTFSKTLFPSLRLGYIVIPPALVARFLAVRRANDLFPSHLYQAALADFISRGHFTRHVRKTRQLYAERRTALAEALQQEFATEIENSQMQILGAEAGMHLVVTLPPGLSDRKIAMRAAQEGLWLWPLSSAYAGADVRQGFILGFGGTRADDMLHQVRRLRKAVRSESGYPGRAKSGH
ncbi:MAG TPA: PLP-dependent aminotransferase family protein [Bryobacteraceae bacterium]|nr:PLP-dependent aminotransferase family protein [Bryobacteraceae bacterium]